MKDNARPGKTSGTTDASLPVVRLTHTAGTLQSSRSHITSHSSIAVDPRKAVAEAEAIFREDVCIRAYHAVVPERTLEAEETEEQEWHTIVNQPHVQQGLHHLAERIRQQIARRETEEGGFAIE